MSTGFPVAWNTVWSVLAWRHERPHRPTMNSQAALALEANQENASQEEPKERCEEPLAIQNGATGLNNRRLDKKHAVADTRRRCNIEELPSHRENVSKGEFVFISVPDLTLPEGELQVGLAVALEDCAHDEQSCKFKWFIRCEWACKTPQHEWSKTPIFKVAGDPTNPKKAYISEEPLNRVLPVNVRLTQNCKGERPRLTAECVRVIRELCQQRGLINTSPTNAKALDNTIPQQPHTGKNIANSRPKRQCTESRIQQDSGSSSNLEEEDIDSSELDASESD